VRWLGHHSNAQQEFANLADVWAPGQDMSNKDSLTALMLTALTCTHALLLADYECIEWGPAAGPASSAAPMAIAGSADTQNPTAGGTGPTSLSATVAGFTPTIYAVRQQSLERSKQRLLVAIGKVVAQSKSVSHMGRKNGPKTRFSARP